MRAGALPATSTIAPVIRIRAVLLLGALAFAVWWSLPRARAAFQLYSAATAFADYALCMVGPTGPGLLRGNPHEFWRLARRKLVSSPPDEHPFKKCEKSARSITDSVKSRDAHQSPAMAFAEWGTEMDGKRPVFTLPDLGVGTRRLAELSESAWPFVRDGYTALIQPSSYAAEAPHPLEPPRPAIGRGAVPHRSLSRCQSPEGETEFALEFSSDRRWKVVRSSSGGGASTEVRFAPVEARIFSLTCDALRAVVGIGREGSRDAELVSCVRGGACERMPLPKLTADGPSVKFPLDVARVEGTTVLATTMRGIVRVASTRDEGVSWTPITVAFDPAEGRGSADTTARFVTVGRRLLLVGEASGGYWALASDDAGASWHMP
jgi:hypothetical protein